MPKNVVIACDGTNNSLQSDLTNVALLSEVADRTAAKQHVYYDVGVGVDARPGVVTRVGARLSRWSGSAFGTGLVDNLTEAYRELVNHYEPGDAIFLFGFSRGAYTVRALTGALYRYGLLTRPNSARIDDVVTQFQTLFPKEGSIDATDPARKADYLRRTFSEAAVIKRDFAIDCPVHFLGLWDTVSSLGWAYDPKTFPNTKEMPNVKIVRHALAIDERRAKFRTNRVHPMPDQDVREVWFPGVHSDVGGGYTAETSALARICLRWMLTHAAAAGLHVNREALVKRRLDVPPTHDDEDAAQHESLEGMWWGLEYLKLPHRRLDNGRWIDEQIRYRGNGWRTIGAGDRASRVLQRRSQSVAVKNTNWQAALTTIVWED